MANKLVKISSLIVMIALCVAFIGHDNVHKSAGAPVYVTNAPGEQTCSSPEGTNPCHGGGIPDNSGAGTPSILFSGGTIYVPGQTYTVTAKITHPVSNRFGFEIVSLKDSNNAFVGTLALIDPNKTQTVQPTIGSFLDRIYVTHQLIGTYPTTSHVGLWTYKWTAPPYNVGNISFYACYNAANNNNTNDAGDETYWAKITLTPSAIGIEQVNKNSFNISVYPNPAKDFVNIEYEFNTPANVKADLINIEGKIVQQLIQQHQMQGEYKERVLLNESLSQGIYFVKNTIDGKEFLKKIQIEK
jgi:hypothetical protein